MNLKKGMSQIFSSFSQEQLTLQLIIGKQKTISPEGRVRELSATFPRGAGLDRKEKLPSRGSGNSWWGMENLLGSVGMTDTVVALLRAGELW